MLTNFLTRMSRAALIAYGSWALVTLLLTAGTLTSLSQAERTGRQAVLARAEAGSSAVEQTMLRVFEAAQNLQTLAQTRGRLVDAANMAGVQAIGDQLHDGVLANHSGIQAVNIYRHGRLEWTSNAAGWPGSVVAFPVSPGDPPPTPAGCVSAPRC